MENGADGDDDCDTGVCYVFDYLRMSVCTSALCLFGKTRKDAEEKTK